MYLVFTVFFLLRGSLPTVRVFFLSSVLCVISQLKEETHLQKEDAYLSAILA